MKKSLAAIVALSIVALADSSTLAEAFKNGKISGDVGAYYENRHVNKGDKSQYFNNTAWAVGSVGLNYETDFYRNFKAAVGFRGSAPIYEDDKNYDTGHGKGDSTERIYDNSRYLISRLYLEYGVENAFIRVGRQDISLDWINKINDAVYSQATFFDKLTVDAIWTRARGRAYLKEMFKFKRINADKGLSAFGATYKFDNGLALRGYAMHASDIFTGVGGKIMYDTQVSDDVSVGGKLHYAQTNEKRDNVDDGKVFETTAYVKYDDTQFTLGYVQTGKKNGWGSFNIAGDAIVQFEEGDVMYERDVRTYYGMLSTKIEKLSLAAIFGSTSYKLRGGDDTRYRQHEFSTWLSYPVMDNLDLFLTFDKTFKAQPGYPSMTQVSAGVKYSF